MDYSGFDGGFHDGFHGGFHGGHHGGFHGAFFGFGFGHDSSVMNAVDFIGGTFGKDADGNSSGYLDSNIAALRDIDAAKHNAFGVRVRHDAVDVAQLFLLCAERRNLLKVPSILVGGQSIDTTVDGFLPPNAWTATNGYLPQATTEGVGKKTRVFRNFYQIGRKKWGRLQTEYDSTVSHLDVSVMTWSDSQANDFKSQFLIHVVSKDLDEPCKKTWFSSPTSKLAHRTMAKETVFTVATLLLERHKP